MGAFYGAEVLSTAAGDGTVVDGVDGTMVVTGKATGTFAVVEPVGGSASDIVHRTDFCAFATFDADIGVDHKLFVRNHPLVEIAAYDIGVEAWGGALLQGYDTPPAILDDGDDPGQLLSGVGDLTGCLFLSIRVHERQTDIRLGHDDRIERIGMQSLTGQVVVQDGHALAHIVAAGGQRPAEGILIPF